MSKPYKPSPNEIAFIVLIILFITINLAFRALTISNTPNTFSFDGLFSQKTIAIAAIELGIFLIAYFLWSSWKKRK
jgi:cadmium resistance protein CadD (predicted permease)